MLVRTSVKTPKNQQGLVLLVLIIIIALALISYSLSDLSVVQVQVDQVEKTQMALKKAKQALINYALVEADIDAARSGKFGFLPCPDYTNALNEGFQDGNCGATNVSIVGWLPSITLGLPRLRDSTGTCLLYAVSGAYKQSPETNMLNEDTNGQFQVVVDNPAIPIQGVLPEDRIVAIVFAPWKVLTGQTRTFTAGSGCGRDYGNITEYLEGDGITDNAVLNGVADSIDQFIRVTPTSDEEVNPYNDNFITITREELWAEINARNDFTTKMTDLTQALAMCLRDYATANVLDRLPWPATMAMVDYRVSANYDDNAVSGYAGRFPFIVGDSNGVIPVANVSDELFTEAGCNVLLVTSGATVDLQTVGSEYRVLWENWKDHFFYVVSQDYAANNFLAVCGVNCITVDGTPRAAMVVFSNTRQGAQVRNEPIGADVGTKFDINNYMDNGNGGNFPDFTGNGNYLTAGSNDIMYCLTTLSPITVAPC